jgi:hypothetical protein
VNERDLRNFSLSRRDQVRLRRVADVLGAQGLSERGESYIQRLAGKMRRDRRAAQDARQSSHLSRKDR